LVNAAMSVLCSKCAKEDPWADHIAVGAAAPCGALNGAARSAPARGSAAGFRRGVAQRKNRAPPCGASGKCLTVKSH
jgi:hypothetical protein